jgi:hypothetical protein
MKVLPDHAASFFRRSDDANLQPYGACHAQH